MSDKQRSNKMKQPVTATKETKPSFQGQIFKLIETLYGDYLFVVIPTPIIPFAGNLAMATFLSYLLYWTGKGNSPYGVHKSAKELRVETGLTPYAINEARKKFQAMGVLEFKKKRAKGSPTIHYRLNKEILIRELTQFLKDNYPRTEVQKQNDDGGDQ